MQIDATASGTAERREEALLEAAAVLTCSCLRFEPAAPVGADMAGRAAEGEECGERRGGESGGCRKLNRKQSGWAVGLQSPLASTELAQLFKLPRVLHGRCLRSLPAPLE